MNNSQTNTSKLSKYALPPWQDREVSSLYKVFGFTGLVIVFFVFLGVVSIPIGMIKNSTTQGIAWLVALGIDVYIFYLIWNQFLSPATKFTSDWEQYASDKLGAPFEVRFESNYSRTFTGKGSLHFKDGGIEIEGYMPPSLAYQIGIIVVVTVVPLIFLRIGLGIIPALFIAQYLGKKEVLAWMPYHRLSLKLKGRSAALKQSSSTPQKVNLRLASQDGERFYRELNAHYPQALAQFPDLFPASSMPVKEKEKISATPITAPNSSSAAAVKLDMADLFASSTENGSAAEVVFEKEAIKEISGTKYTYRYHRGPNEAAARAFLEQNPVTERCYYLIVKTPVGTFGRDLDGIYKQ